MKNPRIYGYPPYWIAVLDGGPGAAGEMKPVAEALSADFGVLEPLQTATSVDGQGEELKHVIADYADLPVFLIGFSWGAWLGTILTVRFPLLVTKLILVGCRPFEQKYVAQLDRTRTSRLSDNERAERNAILSALKSYHRKEQAAAFRRLHTLVAKTDSYDPVEGEGDTEAIHIDGDVFLDVWRNAEAMRKRGDLLQLIDKITSPVVAIHGDYDPHPVADVFEPLSAAVQDFRGILLQK
jgi:pimeloyl-ACP methyl ester carboxylesterase